jgi:hypothetical protein
MLSIKWFLAFLALLALVLGIAVPALGAEFKGTIKDIRLADDKVVVTSSEGVERIFHFDDSTVIRLNNREATIKDLKAGDQIVVIHDEEDDLNFAKELQCQRR